MINLELESSNVATPEKQTKYQMPKNPEFKKIEISQVGPLWRLEGDFILRPQQSYPLAGFEFKEIKEIEAFFLSIRERTDKWWDKFPNCCDSHKRFITLKGFNKNDFEFIKSQIPDSVKYFIYCLEINIDKEDWFERITQYYDYLNMNLGNPDLGGHIFREAIVKYIDWVKFDKCEFTDDMKLLLIEHIYPSRNEVENRKKNSGELGELYQVFQAWLNSMPSVGEISAIKIRLTGKIPMNLFLTNTKINRYTGMLISETKSIEQLIIELENYSKSLLLAVQNTIKEKFLEDNATIFSLINEKLRIRQEKLFSHSKLPASKIILEWLNIWIDYFTEMKSGDTNGKLSEFIRNTNTFLHKYIEAFDVLDSNIAELRKNLSFLMENIDQHFFNKIQEVSDNIISSIDSKNMTENELNQLSQIIIEKLELSEKTKMKDVASSMKKSQISVKHKLKLSIPLFLFTTYEGEIELNAADKIPSNLTELKELIFKKK